jgi:L-fuculose-phosphate aldolase
MGFLVDSKDIAEELCHHSRLCYERHLVGATGGNLSARIPGKNAFLVTASGMALRDVTPKNLVAVNAEGDVIENPSDLEPSKEIHFHMAIYEAKPEVNAVIHVHPTFATTYAVAGKNIPLATVSAMLKLKQANLVPEADPGSEILSQSIARRVRNAPEGTSVLLLERHGLVTYARTLSEAFDDAELAEDTAKVAYFSSQL